MTQRRAAGGPEHRAHFTLPFEVRDYECDLQGIVNNAAYLHYLEHARHQFLKQAGFSFAELSKAGINLVVVRAEIDYKAPLRSGNRFTVGLRMERLSPVRFQFLQDIHRLDGGAPALILTSRFVCAAMDARGRPMIPKRLEPLFVAGRDHVG